MAHEATITSLRFKNFKAFGTFHVSLRHLNVLVGPNNSGKSTVISACRVLSNAIKHARSKSPDYIELSRMQFWGYHLSPDIIPISLENVHTNYNEDVSTIEFRISNGNHLRLIFTADRECYLMPVSERGVKRPADFKRDYPFTIGVVPVLGPLEHNEQIVEEATVSRYLQTHRASRHFRNFWRYNPNGFNRFSDMIRRTWPGMDIKPPEITDPLSGQIQMFCSENRIARELYWSGFGFQIWCQLLTHISRAQDDALLIIDEPEIYLHPDVQRQLLSILRDLGPDILIATHSTEMMTEADPSEILLVDKEQQSAKRLKDEEGLQEALSLVGSVQNITLSRLARNRRILFIEGSKDFDIIRRFSRKLGLLELSSGSDITAIHSEGFASWQKIKSLAWGFNRTIGSGIVIGTIYDRDYWCEEQLSEIVDELQKSIVFAHIHSRKEIENYLLIPSVLDRAIDTAIEDRVKRGEECPNDIESSSILLSRITDSMRDAVIGQYIAKRTEYLRPKGHDPSTLAKEGLGFYLNKWNDIASRMEIVDGDLVLSQLREEVQRRWKISLTDACIVSSFTLDEIPNDLSILLAELNRFRQIVVKR